MRCALLVAAFAAAPAYAFSQSSPHAAEIDRHAERIEKKVIEWRRDIYRNPELGNREVRTAKVVADHLRALGLEVRSGIAHTGVVALLKGGRPGPVVALRADMDALPVTDQTGLPYASKAKAMWMGQETGVMHACGHDAHVAILMGVAEVLAAMKERVPGTVKFIFQPAEEGAPAGEEGGARLMVKQGVLQSPAPQAIFGLHVNSIVAAGRLGYRAGPLMASSDGLRIVVKGKQTHGARPWSGVDPIVVASQIVLGLQTIASRQANVTLEPSILTIGIIRGGNRGNIIPDEVEMVGTIRAFNEEMRRDIHRRVKQTAESIAQSAGAKAEVSVNLGYDVTDNHEKLTERAVATLRAVAGGPNVFLAPKTTGSEDFSAYQKVIPGFFFFVGARVKDLPEEKWGANHSPLFQIDESVLKLGVRSLATLTMDYLAAN
jgi:amidohydrolase